MLPLNLKVIHNVSSKKTFTRNLLAAFLLSELVQILFWMKLLCLYMTQF